jgi:hypothetical protein
MAKIEHRLWLAATGLALATAASAQVTEKLSLRLSSELTLGTEAARAPAPAPQLTPAHATTLTLKDYRIGRRTCSRCRSSASTS